MARRTTPLFLERRRYRLRRIMDAVRIIPLVGLVLWMIPLLWPTENAPPIDRVTTSQALIYIFCVWCALILAASALSRRLRDVPDDLDATRPLEEVERWRR